MVTDLAEVFRLGTAKAIENLAFRRHLSSHHHQEKAFQIIATKVQHQIDCTTCANCCRQSEVSINKEEIERIASHLGTTPQQASILYTIADPAGPALRILRNAGGCVFLDGNLCMIYEARPKACQDFPHLSVGTHSLGGRPASIGRWAALCPIVYNALEIHKTQTGFPAAPE